jgi:hypothetical protein
MNTTTMTMGRPGLGARLQHLGLLDWTFAALVLTGAAFAFMRYGLSMDGYEKGILVFAVPAVIALGWFWKPIRPLCLLVGAFSLLAISLYNRTPDAFGADLAAADKVFLLKYMLSSQSAILWMSLLFYMSTLFYWGGFFTKSGQTSAAEAIGSRLAWGAVFMALVGTMVRWFESHQIAPTSATSRSATSMRCSCCSRG